MKFSRALFSGVDVNDFKTWLGCSYNSELSLISADEFMQSIRNNSYSSAGELIWLYRAPWHILDGDATATPRIQLETWISFQKELLNIHRTNSKDFKLINIDTVASEYVSNCRSSAEQVSLGDSPTVDHGVVISSLFSEFAPQYWDIFESLEAISWFPAGGPTFRNSASQCGEDQFYSFLIRYAQANSQILTEAKLIKSETDKAVIQDRLSYERLARYQAESDLSQAREYFQAKQKELELDLSINIAQLEQTRRELSDQEVKNGEFNRMIEKSSAVLERAHSLLNGSTNNE